jgi:hypothetical protein
MEAPADGRRRTNSLFPYSGVLMKITFCHSLLLLALLPAAASAVPCQFGCRTTRGCDNAVPASATMPYSLHNLPTAAQQIGMPARSRPSLLPGSAQGPIEYATCDDLNVVGGPGNDYAAYLERDTNGVALSRHRLDIDARGYVGNANPVSGERSWWPGVVAWVVPMASGATAELRIDYSSYRSGYDWSLVGSQVRVMLDGVQVDFANMASDQFAIELHWTPEGEAVVLVADLDAAGRPLETTAIPLAGLATEQFRPVLTTVGRRGTYEFRWSRGEVYISSELSYAY